MNKALERFILMLGMKSSVEISELMLNKKENRIKTLLLKGLIVYLVTIGIFGGTISATGTEYNALVFNVTIFFISIIISLYYYNKKTENIGNILYLFVIIFFGVVFGKYINSGFYTWMNDLMGIAGVYFDLSNVGGYVQMVSNTKYAVTFAACFIGAIGALLINMSIAKKMMYGDLVLDVIIVLFLPVYLGKEPNYCYIVMMVLGITICYIWRNTGRYEKTNDNSVYSIDESSLKISYVYNFKAHLLAFSQIIIVVISLLAIVYIIFPNSLYEQIRVKSNAKDYSDSIVETLITSGISGFFNKYDNIGGVNSGRLGGVNSVRLDYETDLKVVYAPYNFSPVYLRTFVGGDYQPYSNYWGASNAEYQNREEYLKLFDIYYSGSQKLGMGKMTITNIGGEYGEYAPYYSEKHDKFGINLSRTYEYIPFYEDMPSYGNSIFLSDDEREYWLSVPSDNIISIDNFIEKIGVNSSMEPLEVADIIDRYYFENVPYTLRPGATPRRKDFINYFLDSNKKGYCVHFASAATLVFRRLGIPARYVEGYAFDYNDVLSATVLDENYEEYFSGYNPLGKTSVIEVDVLDANAHAWVEIYTDEYGWIPIELTPPSSDNDYSEQSLFERFMALFRAKNDTQDSNNENSTDSNENIDTTKIRGYLLYIVIIIVVLACGYVLVRYIIYLRKYYNADINTRLIMRYHSFITKRTKKSPEFCNLNNYREQIEYCYKGVYSEEDIEKLINILERAGFSPNMISVQEFEFVIKKLSGIIANSNIIKNMKNNPNDD